MQAWIGILCSAIPLIFLCIEIKEFLLSIQIKGFLSVLDNVILCFLSSICSKLWVVDSSMCVDSRLKEMQT